MALFRYVPAGDLALVPTADGKTTFSLLSGGEAVRQKLATRLKFFLGEWFRNLREGVPFFRYVFIQNPDLDVVRTVFRKVILSVQEVKDVSTLTIDFDHVARTCAVEFDVTLVDGGVLQIRQPDAAFIIDLQAAA